jgi:hypothetical protein
MGRWRALRLPPPLSISLFQYRYIVDVSDRNYLAENKCGFNGR